MNRVLFFGVLLLIVSGCTNKGLYNTLQTNRMDCLKEDAQQLRDACNSKVDTRMSYDQYHKARQKL